MSAISRTYCMIVSLICYTDKEVRIFLKKLFKNPLTFP